MGIDEYQNPMEEYHESPSEKPEFEPAQEHLLSCPSCGQFVKAADINIDKTIAKCSNCDHVFSFGHTFQHHGDAYSRPEILIPEGLEVLKLRSELDILVNWRRSASKSAKTFQIIFTVFWNLVLLPFVLLAIFGGQWIVLLFTSLHLIVGVFMMLRLAAMFMNTTHVNVTKRFIEWRTTPLSMFGKNRKIETYQVDQLYVSRYVEGTSNGKPHHAYTLYLVLKNGKKIKLVKGMNLETQRFLEYEIESFLHIEDEQVEGEWGQGKNTGSK